MTQPKQPESQIKGGPVQPPTEKGWVKIPDEIAGLIRWVLYSILMFVLLLPFLWNWQIVTGALLLGHFSSQITNLKNK